MRKILYGLAAMVAACLALVPAQASVVLNGTPTAGWGYGSGNNYSPANTVVNTNAAGDQVYGRVHVTYVQAPAADVNGVYSFLTGIPYMSFDWGVTNSAGTLQGLGSLLTITDLATNLSFSFNPLAVIGNDNWVSGGTAQNSLRVNWFLPWDPNANDTYRFDWTVSGLQGGPLSITTYGQVGTGAASPAPEPSSWAMMLLGFGAIGLALRKARRKPRLLQLA